MNSYFSIVKADYLQRFRSYTFIVTLLVSVMIAYSFVPEESANYTTIQVGDYVGLNNAAWIGHVTAIMASTFLWLIGFYVINNGIRRDKETGVGQIIATTSITNFQYLLSKSLSNFLVLLSITTIIILMALGLLFTRGSSYEFNISQFFLPHLFTTLPSIFFLSAFTIFLEVVFGTKTNLLNVVFFFVSVIALAIANFDPLGTKFLMNEIVTFVNESSIESKLNISEYSVGFQFKSENQVKYFLYPGSNFTIAYLFSRLLWGLMAFVMLKLSAVLFDRFDSKVIASVKGEMNLPAKNYNEAKNSEINRIDLIKVETNFGLFPLIKTEFMMLLRKGPSWFWVINALIFITLFFIPLSVALKTVLPIFWFLQVNRWAYISTKEKFFGTDKLIYSTYKPLQRLLVSQILAGIILATLMAMPVIIKLILDSQFLVMFEVILGSIILVSFAVCSGIITGGKRFFEIAFFLITYLSVRGFYFLDYWGGSHSSINYVSFQFLLFSAFLCVSFLVRQYAIKRH